MLHQLFSFFLHLSGVQTNNMSKAGADFVCTCQQDPKFPLLTVAFLFVSISANFLLFLPELHL